MDIEQIIARQEEEFNTKFCNEKHYDSSSPLHSNYQNGGIGRLLNDMEEWHSSSIKEILELVVEREKERIKKEKSAKPADGVEEIDERAYVSAKSDTINYLEEIISKL